jgi:hypothetical protein
MARSLAVLAAVVALSVPAVAGADTVKIDFEAPAPAPPVWNAQGTGLGTVVNDEYLTGAFTRFLSTDFGFRPFRNTASGNARSGTVVADVGADVCFADTGDAGGCEFAVGGSSGRLTRTAQKITLYAGLFTNYGNPAANVTAQLIAYDPGGAVAATGAAVPIFAGPFDSAVTVTSASANIARWELHVGGTDNVGAAVGFDDLTMDFPANSLPDFSLSTGSDVRAVLQGQTTDVPVQITRLNGSAGPVRFGVSGLPVGISAQVVPNPVTGAPDTATVKLTAAVDAPAFDVPTQITITADPQGDGSVAPAARSVGVLLRVAEDFGLRADGATTAAVPACTSVDVPFTLTRDRAFTGTVTLAATGLPAGVTAEILPGTTIAPGGNVFVTGTLRLTGSTTPPATATVTLRATAPGAPDKTLAITVGGAAPTATLDSGLGLTPRALQPGTTIHATGNGFCPGTRVRVGTTLAESGATVDPDGHGLTFVVPRFAVPGAVTILPPAPRGGFTTTNTLLVKTFRGTYGFPFGNFDYGTLSIDELTDEFGAGDLFIRVNPCWPFGSCSVNTGILNPVAAVAWGVLNIALHSSHGHCFGISRAVQELMNRKTPYRRFSGTATVPYELPSAAAPSSGLSDWLDAKHAAQGSSEFLNAWAGRDRTVAGQVARARSELAAGRLPMITLAHGGLTDGEGHAMLVYDLQPTADGGTDLYVYDNNRPQTDGELGNPGSHQAAEQASVVHTTAHGWSFDLGSATWTSGDDGKLFVVPFSTIPDDPSLPGLSDLVSIPALMIFGSDGAAKTSGAGDGAQYLPALDDSAAPGANGFLTFPKGVEPEHELQGVKRGAYSDVLTGDEAAAGVAGVETRKGVEDTLSGSVSGNPQMRFESGASRSLDLTLATGGTAAGTAATISTRSASGGSESASLTPGGALAYAHDGRATSYTFTLTKVQRNGGATTFTSPALRIGNGDRVSARPVGRDLARVRVTTRKRGGATSTRVVRTRATKGAGRLKVGKATLKGRKASARATIAGVKGRAVLGAVLRVTRGGRTVARRSTSIAKAANGRPTLRFATLPKLARGTYRLAVDVRLITADGRAATTRRSSAATVRVG